MDKPWDVLRVAEKKPPIGCGSFTTRGGTVVRLEKLFATDVVISFQPFERGKLEIANRTLRDLGEFFIELADQIDNKIEAE